MLVCVCVYIYIYIYMYVCVCVCCVCVGVCKRCVCVQGWLHQGAGEFISPLRETKEENKEFQSRNC